jgi:adenylate kinase
MKIVLLGPPGSGKGAQSVRIKERYPHLCYINPTDLLRDEIRAQSPIGVQAQARMLSGERVPDDTYFQLALQRMRNVTCRPGYVLDGMPKTATQAEKFAEAGEKVDAVVRLEVPDDVVVERTSGRWTHRASGRVYHAVFAPPKTAGKDDLTGEPLVQRADDYPDVARARLGLYKQNIEDIMRFYQHEAPLGPREGAAAAAAAAAATAASTPSANTTTAPTSSTSGATPSAGAGAAADVAAAPVAPPPAPVKAGPNESFSPVPPAAIAAAVADAIAKDTAAAGAAHPASKPWAFQRSSPTVRTVDGRGTSEEVRQRLFAVLDEVARKRATGPTSRRPWWIFW